MHAHRRHLRLVALAVVVALPLFGMSGVATAKVKAKGCHKTHTCKGGGGTGSGTGGSSDPITVQIDPNPVVEIGPSDVIAVIQVGTSPAFAGDLVAIQSSQLLAACRFPGSVLGAVAPLDNEGNTVGIVEGGQCAAGTYLVDASLTVAPFFTATTELTIEPPIVTTPGVYGYPTSSGIVKGGDVETGDGPGSDQSAVVAVFDIETDPVYAEQLVEISSPQLQARCLVFSWASLAALPPFGTPPTETTLDNDGNALFVFVGVGCAAGPSVVTADVLAGTHPTYTTTFNILPPQPTI